MGLVHLGPRTSVAPNLGPENFVPNRFGNARVETLFRVGCPSRQTCSGNGVSNSWVPKTGVGNQVKIACATAVADGRSRQIFLAVNSLISFMPRNRRSRVVRRIEVDGVLPALTEEPAAVKKTRGVESNSTFHAGQLEWLACRHSPAVTLRLIHDLFQ